MAAHYRDLARAGLWSAIWTYTPNSSIPPFPPLYHMALAAVSGAPEPASAAVWVNWLYLVVLALSVFGAALELRRDPWSAAAAAAAFAGAPVVQELLRTPLIDLPLTALAAFAYWTLLRCDRFARWKAAVLFGLACGAGMLHKWSFFSYLLPAAVIWAGAMRRPESRRQAAVAAALGVGLAAPWYLIRLPLVAVRLTQATNDFVVPFWRGTASLRYLEMMPSQLGLAFTVVAGLACVLAARGIRVGARGRPLLACLACAYAFWALLPNRQFRYILPALPAAAVFAAAVAPAPVLWGLAAWQASGAASRWRAERRQPMADWPVAAVVTEITRREPGTQLVPVAVIANSESFNKLDFVWYAHRLGAAGLRFRGVKDIPWELSSYVIFKTGSLGPDSVTADFRDAADEIARPDGWFAHGFEAVARWPLPDGSEAVLFARRRVLERPFARARLETRLGFSSLIAIPQAEVTLGPWDSRRGVYRTATIVAPEVLLQGLRVSDLRLRLENALIVPDGGGARLLRVSRVSAVSATVGADALRERLSRAGVRTTTLTLERAARLSARVRGVPLTVELKARAGAGELCSLRLKAASLAFLPLPPALVERYALNGPVLELRSTALATSASSIFGLSRSWPVPTAASGCSFAGGRLLLR